MAIPRKGSRRIEVNGAAYLWRIRSKATYSQADYGCGYLHVAVAAERNSGTTLVIVTDRPHPWDIPSRQAVPVTPVDVREWILRALELGWEPEAKGSPLCGAVRKGTLVSVANV